MKRVTVLSIIALVVLMLSVGAVAQDDAVSVCGTFSGSAQFLPSISSSFGLNLTIGFAGFTVTSDTSFTPLPTVSANQSFALEYTWDVLTFGSRVDMGLIPALFQSWDVYAKLNFPDTTIGDGANAPTFAGNLRVDAVILPAFAGTGTLYISMDVGPLSASSTSIVGFVPVSFQTQKFKLSIDFLSATLDDAGTSTASGELGADIDVLPALATTVWLDLSLSLGDLTADSKTSFEIIPGSTGTQVFTLTYSLESITFTGKTTFTLAPYGFDSQYFKINVTYDDLSVYGWGTLATSGLSAGAGFSYNFCTP